jgi:hypothetical protein
MEQHRTGLAGLPLGLQILFASRSVSGITALLYALRVPISSPFSGQG